VPNTFAVSAMAPATSWDTFSTLTILGTAPGIHSLVKNANASRSSSTPIRVVTSNSRPRPISSKTSFPSADSTRRLKLIDRNLTPAR